MTTGPSLEGMAQIQFAAAALKPYEPPRRRRRWPRWLTAKRLVLIVVATVVVASLGWHYLTKPNPSGAGGAVLAIAHDASHNDWPGVYDQLCQSDRQQISEADLHDAGRAALLSLGELDHVTVSTVRPTSLAVGPVRWSAAQVSGKLVPVVGQPSDYTVTVIHERGAWRPCLSAGGYRSTALGVDVPLGSATLQL